MHEGIHSISRGHDRGNEGLEPAALCALIEHTAPPLKRYETFA